MIHLKQKISLLLTAAAVLTVAASACADSIKLTNGITYDRIKIVGVADGMIRFQMGRRDISKPVSELAFVNIANDKNFTQGETLLGQSKYAEAEKAYVAAGRLAKAEWKKTLIDYRLLVVNDAAGHIDKATARWLKIVDDADASAGALSLCPKNSPRRRARQTTGPLHCWSER